MECVDGVGVRGVVGMGILSRGRRGVGREAKANRSTPNLGIRAPVHQNQEDDGGPGRAPVLVPACACVLWGCGCRV